MTEGSLSLLGCAWPEDAEAYVWGRAGTNHLGHFLLANLLLEDIQKAPEGSLKRVIIVGSITGGPRGLVLKKMQAARQGACRDPAPACSERAAAAGAHQLRLRPSSTCATQASHGARRCMRASCPQQQHWSMRPRAGNTNTLAGNVPPKASLGDMSGLASGLGEGTTAMIDGLDFDGAKASRPARGEPCVLRDSELAARALRVQSYRQQRPGEPLAKVSKRRPQ